MEYRGTIRSGLVVLDNGGAGLPDGTQVRVTPIEAPARTDISPATEVDGASLRALLLSFAGRFKGLPSDLSRNHDHCIHGTPRE